MTPKRQRFVIEYLIDLNATQAAIRAGYSAKSARQVGHQNLTKHDISTAIAVAQKEHAELAGVTIESMARQLDEDRTFARENKNSSAAVAATMGKAKLYGLLIDKSEAKVEHDIPSVTTAAEAQREVKEIFGVAKKPVPDQLH